MEIELSGAGHQDVKSHFCSAMCVSCFWHQFRGLLTLLLGHVTGTVVVYFSFYR